MEMNTDPSPVSLVLYPQLARAFLSVPIVVAMPMIFLVPLSLYANTLPPRPAGGILNAQTLELFCMTGLFFTGLCILWTVDCLVLRRRQWRVSAEGIEVQRKGVIMRRLPWAQITFVEIQLFGIGIHTGRSCERLCFADPKDMALLREWHRRYRGNEAR